MNPYTLFVADIHLQPNPDHPINLTFEAFLKDEAPKAEALYILGDLFEMWAGDDVGLDVYAPIIKQIRQLTDNNLAVYCQYGNRDFLMRNAFWLATGIQFLPEPYAITLYQHPCLLMHGDRLCTDDTAYQRMRVVLRNPVVQWIFLHLSRKRRLKIGHKMRLDSAQHSQQKSQAIMDVNEKAIYDLLKQYPATRHLIHGHTHRPQHHPLKVDSTSANTPADVNTHLKVSTQRHRWVLGDWRASHDGPSQVLRLSILGPELIPYTAGQPLPQLLTFAQSL